MMLMPDGRCSHVAVVCAGRLVSFESAAGGGDPGSPAADQCASEQIPKRFAFGIFDRWVFVGLYRLVPGIVDALSIIQPETLVRWHRAGFRLFWRWKSRRRGGRPRVPVEIRQLIRDMSLASPLWGAPRIHGELLKLGIDVGQTSVAKYMARGRRGPSQGWRTFLCNHADGIGSMDLFVAPTVSFRHCTAFWFCGTVDVESCDSG